MSEPGAQPDAAELPPRRAVVRLLEREMKALLGLAADESLRAVIHEPRSGHVDFVCESPRLAPMGYKISGQWHPAWDGEAPAARLPLSDYYEKRDHEAQP